MNDSQSSRRFSASNLRDQSRDSLEFETVRTFFAEKAQTQVGRAWIQSLDLLDDTTQTNHYHQLIGWFDLLRDQQPLHFPIIPDPRDFERNPLLAPFEAADLRSIRDSLRFWLTCWDHEDLHFSLGEFPPEETLIRLVTRLESLFDRDGAWHEQVSPTFQKLIQAYFKTEEQLEQTLTQLLRRFGSFLNESAVFERNNRKVLAVKLDFKGKVKGRLQDYSSSGRTVFIEPEATLQLQNRLTEIESEIEEELWRIRCEASEAILEQPIIADQICPILAKLDGFQALAVMGNQARCIPIQPNHDQELFLLEARHPLLDEAFEKSRIAFYGLDQPDRKRMIAFSLRLDQDQRGLVLSGANTGGKTVTLKTVGLLAWMANSGFPVPVDEGSEIPHYQHILADIGDHQSLSHNLSTYASHLANLRQILTIDTSNLLVLLDELGSGTDPREGNALAHALIEVIMSRGFHLLVTTHQQVLCTLALNHSAMDNAAMAFDTKQLRPTYRYRQGVPGRSHALDIAKQAGLPGDILERAHQLLDDNEIDIQSAIKQLQARHHELEKQRKKLRRDELRLHRRIQETKAERGELENLKQVLKNQEQVKLKKKMEKAERELRALLSETASPKQVRRSFAKLAAVRQGFVEPELPQKLAQEDIDASGQPFDQWQVGDRVLLKTFRKEGKIVSLDRKRVRVDSEGKAFSVRPDELLHLQGKVEPAAKVHDLFEAEAEAPLSTELKLIGFRAEDALMELDRVIDHALRRELPFLRIIHGHGSGILKRAVRDFLKNHQAKRFFEVLIDLKNDGVTEVRFGEAATAGLDVTKN